MVLDRVALALLLAGLSLAGAQSAQAASQTFAASADAYVHQSRPSKNYGSSTSLKADASPKLRSYLRFSVVNLSGMVTRATLRVRSSNTSSVGFSVHAVSNKSWRERTITYSNARAFATTPVASRVPMRKGSWSSADVTSLVEGNGVVSFALTTRTGVELRLSSREAGRSYAPRLVVETLAGVEAPAPPAESAPAPPPPPPSGSCQRPYSDSSPWNMPIGSSPTVVADSPSYVSSLGPTLTSDPTQYTYPVYYVDASTATVGVKISGTFSNVYNGGNSLTNQSGGSVQVRIPASAQAAAGTDSQLIILDPATGDEWGFWRLAKDASGNWTATNGYHYNTNWSGVPPKGFVSRGAGVPYLTGLVRPCEIERGSIDHALAFAYDYPANQYIYPATKSDGKSAGAPYMPEGARLQLDPSISEAEIRSWGCSGPCLTIAKAMQTYGMYIIDNSGRDKITVEYDGTARWNGLITSSTISPIPSTRLRWVQ